MNDYKHKLYVFHCRISDGIRTPPSLPFFLFGDFNFRLDTQNLVEV